MPLMVVVIALTACDSGSSGSQATPTPAVAGPSLSGLVEPPPPAAAPGPPAGPAETALRGAADRTSQVKSYRLQLNATLGGGQQGQASSVGGQGRVESPTRSDIALTVSAGTTNVVVESLTYDGATYSRQQGGAWQRSAKQSKSAGSSYLNYIGSATQVADTGPGDRNGTAAEKYTAVVGITGRASPQPGQPQIKSVQLVAWVGKASGLIIGEDLVFISPQDIELGRLQLDFFDFGASIQLHPPALGSP